jgi:hypothetical protein
MIDELDREQREVLFEFIDFVKRTNKAYHPLRLKEVLYDKHNGEGESIELLNLCFYDLIRIEKLNHEEIKELAEILSQREINYKIDPEDPSREEKEELNKINLINREKHKTNGLEYLRWSNSAGQYFCQI